MEQHNLNLDQLEQKRWYDEERANYSVFPWAYLEDIMRKVSMLDAMMNILRNVYTHLNSTVCKKEHEVDQEDINSVDYVLSRLDSCTSALYREKAARRLNHVFIHRHDAEYALEELMRGYNLLRKQMERWTISIRACTDEMLNRNGIKLEENRNDQ